MSARAHIGIAELQADQPKYESIKRALLGRIKRGEWQVGGQIPSENELASEYRVSRVTIRRTLRELVAAGVIIRVIGAGTFVARRRMRAAFVRLDDWGECGSATSRRCETLVRRLLTLGGTGRYDIRQRRGSSILCLIVRWWHGDSVTSTEHWLIDVGGVPDIGDPAHADTSVLDCLHEHQPVDAIDEEIRVTTPPETTRRILEIADPGPRISVTRRLFSGGQWLASVRETYAEAGVMRRYRTLSALSSGCGDGVDDAASFSRTLGPPPDDRWLY